MDLLNKDIMKPKIVIPLALLLTFGSFFVFRSVWSEPSLADGNRFSWHTFSSPVEPSSDNVSETHRNQVQELKMYLQEHPEDTTHLLRLARLYHDGHNPGSAAIYYERFLKIHPKQRQVWLDLANCFAESSQWPKALEATESMLQYYPSDGEGRYNLGAIYANMGNSEQAVTVWNQLNSETSDPKIRQLAVQSIERIKPLK